MVHSATQTDMTQLDRNRSTAFLAGKNMATFSLFQALRVRQSGLMFLIIFWSFSCI